MKTVGEIIREQRLSRGWTLKQLAEKSGVHYVQIARVETGVREVRVDTLLRICVGLGVSMKIFDAAKPLPVTT